MKQCLAIFGDRRDRRTGDDRRQTGQTNCFEDRQDRRTDEALWDDYFIAASEKKGDVFLLCPRFFVSLPAIINSYY